MFDVREFELQNSCQCLFSEVLWYDLYVYIESGQLVLSYPSCPIKCVFHYSLRGLTSEASNEFSGWQFAIECGYRIFHCIHRITYVTYYLNTLKYVRTLALKVASTTRS